MFLYFYDRFQSPSPLRPDVVVAIDSVIEKKLDALAELKSQFIEGGALGYKTPQIPKGTLPDKQHPGVQRRIQRPARVANLYRDKLIELYGEEKGKQVKYAEAFEICEYGKQPTKKELLKLFPFFPKKKQP